MAVIEAVGRGESVNAKLTMVRGKTEGEQESELTGQYGSAPA